MVIIIRDVPVSYYRFPGIYYRAMHYSAKRAIAIACRPSVPPSIRLSICLTSWQHTRLEILETNCTDN